MIQTFTRGVDAYTEVNKRTGHVRAIISTDENDRFNTVFDPCGAELDEFHANPVVLWDHGNDSRRGTEPVGEAVEKIEQTTFKGKRSLLMETKFYDDDEFCRTLGERYRSLKMRAWSIRAQPHVASPPTVAERRARADWAGAAVVYRNWTLLEVSAVAVPGNASTLTVEVLRSLANRQPSVTRAQLEQLARVLKGGHAQLEALLAGMTDAERRTFIASLKLQAELATWQNIVENREEFANRKKEYAVAAAQREREKFRW
jgi:hypothetical protein